MFFLLKLNKRSFCTRSRLILGKKLGFIDFHRLVVMRNNFWNLEYLQRNNNSSNSLGNKTTKIDLFTLK